MVFMRHPVFLCLRNVKSDISQPTQPKSDFTLGECEVGFLPIVGGELPKSDFTPRSIKTEEDSKEVVEKIF